MTDFQTVRKDVQGKIRYTTDREKIAYSLAFTGDEIYEQYKLYLLFYALKKALAYKRMGCDFATTLSVQSMVDVCGEFVVDWKTPENPIESWKVESILLNVSKETIEQRYEEFDKKWKPKGRREEL